MDAMTTHANLLLLLLFPLGFLFCFFFPYYYINFVVVLVSTLRFAIHHLSFVESTCW